MDHVVYLDTEAKEYDTLMNGSKTMIIRGAAGRKLPYGRVKESDVLYFINNNAEGIIKAKAIVTSVFNSNKMDKEISKKLVEDNQEKLQLTKKQFNRWAGKRFLVLIGVDKMKEIGAFKIDKSDYNNMDDWLPVIDISNVKQ